MWALGCAPCFDLAVYLACSCTEEQQAERVSNGLKIYYDTLVANGLSSYTWEQFNKDFDAALALPATIGSFSGKMVRDVMAGAMAAPEGSEDRKNALAMVEGLKFIFGAISSRTKKLVSARNAWNHPFINASTAVDQRSRSSSRCDDL